MKILNILVRHCVAIDKFDETVLFYEKLIGQKARLYFDYKEYLLKLAQVGNLLFIGGSEISLAPFIATNSTFMVEGIVEFSTYLPTIGASIIEPPKKVPTGWNMLVRHFDGLLVEYVEHTNKNPADKM